MPHGYCLEQASSSKDQNKKQAKRQQIDTVSLFVIFPPYPLFYFYYLSSFYYYSFYTIYIGKISAGAATFAAAFAATFAATN